MKKTNHHYIKLTLLTSILASGLIQTAVAASTTVTDAAGTQEIWTFQEILGAQKLVSKVNQVDNKGVYQTWDTNGNLLTRTDAEGRVTKYTYNATNQRERMTEAFGTPQARVTEYEYVSADVDLVTKTIVPSIFAGNNKETINAYDANLNITSVTINGYDTQGNPVSRSTSFSHNTYGQVTEIDGPRTDVSDITTLEYYDCNTGAECGQLKKVTNAMGHVTTYDSYDGAARLTQSTDPNGNVTTYSYHPRGWILSMVQTPVSGTPRITTYVYDNVGQLKQVTLPDGSERHYEYDAAHDLREIYDNLGNKVTYLYDAKGNRTHEQVYDPDGTLVRSSITAYDHRNFIESINNGGSITQLINDAVGNLSEQTDPNLNPSTEHDFDALDRLSSTIDALTNTSGYDYNVADQLIQVTAPNGAVTQYEYDDLGNLTKETSPDRGTITYAHDEAGNVISATDARGVVGNYQYDALNRLTQLTYPTPREKVRYFYDEKIDCYIGIGRICGMKDNSGLKTFSYDAWGNRVYEQRNHLDEDRVPAGSYITLYEYDDADRISRITYPSGREVNYVRNAIGQVTGVGTTDANGVTQDIVTDREYRGDGLWTSQTFGNGLTQIKVYDTQGRLESHSAGSVYDRSYDYDANGNITDAQATDASLDKDYGYDALDRLTTESDLIRSMIRGFDYDENGNRELLTEGAQSSLLSYEVNSNRLSTIDGSAITLDASGRTITDAQGRTYSYNEAGRLKSIESGGQTLAVYMYNYLQQRTQKMIGDDLTVYHYDLYGNMIAESKRDQSSIREYVYVEGERVAAIVPNIEPDSTPDPSPSNLALGKVATQSSIANAGMPARAVDGVTDGVYSNGTLSSTQSEAQPWWQVDLKHESAIDSITIHNRVDAATDRLADFHVLISDEPFGNQSLADLLSNPDVTSFYHNGALSNDFVTIVTTGTVGRHVRLQLSGTNYLHFSEMEIVGTPTGNAGLWNNLTDGKTASQISTYASADASRAVDGNSNPIYTDGSVSLTTNTTQPWWQVDLGDQEVVNKVRIYHRRESTASISDRLSDFYVLLSPSPFGTRTLTQLLADSTIEQYFHSGSFTSPELDVDLQNAEGRYLRIQLANNNHLELAEVEVLQDVALNDSVTEESGVHFYINDHLFTPQLAVNQSQVITWQADYEAFGNTDITVESFVNNHRFPGQYYDSESGLYYNWNRYYDPETGRYVTSDPIGLEGGLNTFGYAYQNPLYWIDPDGLNGFHPGFSPNGNGPKDPDPCGCLAKAFLGIDDAVTAGGLAAAGGATGPFANKPRGGIAGGGPSGKKTSLASKIISARNKKKGKSGGSRAARKIARKVFTKGIPGVGAGQLIYDTATYLKCIEECTDDECKAQ